MVPRLIADRRPVPDELIEPELNIAEITLIDAWGDLTGDRYTELGAIPFAAIDLWASRNGIADPDDFAFAARAIRAADRAYLAWASEQLTPKHPAPLPERAKRG